MIDKVEAIIKEAKRIADVLTSYPGEIRVYSHYDCDGICAAAIITKALGREGRSFRLSFVKKLNDRKIDEIAASGYDLIVFTDLGSGKLEAIQDKLLVDRKRVIVIDHHQMQGKIRPENRERLLHLNPVMYGVDENISGSGASYMVTRAMSPLNRDLSELAIIGAIGDSQIGSIGPDWGLIGLNKEILADAEQMKKVRVERGLRLWGRYTRPVHKALQYSTDPYIPGVSGSESSSIQFLQELGIPVKAGDAWRTLADLTDEEVQKLASGIIKERVFSGEANPEWIFGDVYDLLEKKDEFRDANEFATIINACGKLGKEFLGVALCFNNGGVADDVRKALTEYRREIGKSISMFEKNRDMISEKAYGTYVLAGDRINEDMISNVISTVSRSGLVPESKPVFAFVDTEDGEVKISARLIDTNRPYNLNQVLSEAAAAFGGEGGGHKFAAGATIPKGTEEMFINRMEEILKHLNGTEEIKTVADNNDAQPQNGEVLNNKPTDVKSEVDVGGERTTAGPEKEGRRPSSGTKMEGEGLVRYFNA